MTFSIAGMGRSRGSSADSLDAAGRAGILMGEKETAGGDGDGAEPSRGGEGWQAEQAG